MDPILLTVVVIDGVLSLAAVVLCVVMLQRKDDGARARLEEAVRDELRASGSGLRDELRAQRSELGEQLGQEREERQRAQTVLRQELGTMHGKLADSLATGLDRSAERIDALNKSNADKHIELRQALSTELEKLRKENEAKLEQMRATVDEKLQGTLEKRLGESFTLVSKRLEEVQKGLGEMQTLAQDVGGLKRVLTNVKSRGGWGEVQLERQLEDILTRDQYEANVAVRPGSGERVEFAVKLPGRDESGAVVYLPIDSKFPQEDYERLLDAQDRGEKSEIEEAGKAVERAILEQAKTIAKKYIEPPYSTDFAIMYLPTEGLFAEVVRRAGLAARLQSEHRVLLTGPTTLMSLLNSLQMGFRTLAIERRSSEVWQVLGAAKAEFQKYGQVWDKLQKQLSTAQNTVNEASVRTRAIERKLRGVESIEQPGEAPTMIGDLFDDLEAAAEDDRLEPSGP